MSHMAEKHRNQLRPAGETFCSPFCLMFGNELSKFCAGKVMKQLTKQACNLYHDPTLLGCCDVSFVGAKILHHNPPGGYSI